MDTSEIQIREKQEIKARGTYLGSGPQVRISEKAASVHKISIIKEKRLDIYVQKQKM